MFSTLGTSPHPPAQVDKLSKQVDNTKAELHLQQGNLSQRQGAQGGLLSVLEWDIYIYRSDILHIHIYIY